MNWKAFLHSLAAAAIGGAVTAATQAIGASGKVDKSTGAAAGAGALVGVLYLLKQSPLGQPPQQDPPKADK